jgi:tetratricopeptide (TPR) repeat protein
MVFFYQANQNSSFDINVNLLKNALSYYPFHSKYWYVLMSIDPSSSARSIRSIEEIEPESVNLLAWKGNTFSINYPEDASIYFENAISRAPSNPHSVRAYADHLYRNNLNQDLALNLYQRYLELVPNFYTWKDHLLKKTLEEQKSYRVFFKNTPDFWNVFDRIESLKPHPSSHSSF